jgi:MFS family permease
MTSSPSDVLRERVDVARRAVAVVFIVNGFLFATLFARLPDVRTGLGLDPGQLGLLLLCLSSGTLVALPTSGLIISRLGPRRTVLGATLLAGVAYTCIAAGVALESVPVTAVALFFGGMGISTWDVSMNVEGADVERRLARPLMPRFHAGFSIGSVGGAAIAAVCSHLGVGLPAQLSATCVVVVVVIAFVLRGFLPVVEHEDDGPRTSPLRAWQEPRTLAIGLVVLSFALCEGIANDWLALGLVDGYDVPHAAGSAGFAVFVTAMTVGRLVGGSATTRFGRVATLRATAVLVIIGSTTVVFSPVAAGAYAGAVVWGLGASLGFPMGMTAAGDDPRKAAARLSVVSSIGYAAFLGGPPLVGTLADHIGIHESLLVAVGAAVLGIVVSGAVRERELPGVPAASEAAREPRP